MNVCLGDICEILNGYSFKSSNYVDNGIRIIRISNVQKGYIDDSQPVFYPSDFPGLKKFMLKEGDLLVSLTGNIGRVAILDKKFLPAALNQRVACLRTNESLISSRYLFHIMNSQKFEQDCFAHSNGIAQLNLSTNWLKKYSIVLYGFEKQNKIVKQLDSILSLIDKTNTLIRSMDDLAKSEFIEIFKNCESYTKLGDSFDVHARIGWQSLTKKEHMDQGDYYLVTGTDFHENKIEWSTCCYVSKGRYDMDKKLQLRLNDVLITKDGSIGKVAIVDSLPKPATLNAGVFVVRQKNDMFTKEYVSYLFMGSLFSDFVNRQKTGATIKHLNQERLLKFSFPCPTLEQQNAFTSFVTQIEKSKLKLKQLLEKLDNLYKSLQHKYFG